jgi:hypothetical protein
MFWIKKCADPSTLIAVRPYKHARGLDPAKDFLRTIRGVYSFEIWFEDKAKIRMCSSEPEIELRKRITSFYPSAEISKPDKDFIDDEKFWVVRVTLCKDYSFPLRTDMDEDSFNTLLTAMIGHKAVYQVLFTPTPQRWMSKAVKVAEELLKGKVVGWLEPKIVQSPLERELAKQIIDRASQLVFVVEIRIAVFGEDSKATNFEPFFNLFYNPVADQGFKLVIPRNQKAELEKMKKRCMTISRFGRKDILTVDELALLAHVFGEELYVREVEWTFVRRDLKPLF